MTPTAPSNPNQGPQGLTPEALANQLCDAAMSQAMAQGMPNGREVAQRVIGFLTEALFYAITAAKHDVVVYLTETIILAASAVAGGDDAARKELLKHIGDTIANAPPLPAKPADASPGKP